MAQRAASPSSFSNVSFSRDAHQPSTRRLSMTDRRNARAGTASPGSDRRSAGGEDTSSPVPTVTQASTGPAAYSDCDSDGNDPPKKAKYVAPALLDAVGLPPPPSTSARIHAQELANLPYAQVSDRIRHRNAYASRVSYEEWVDEDAAEGMPSQRLGLLPATMKDRAKMNRETDSDFPLGRPYFWKAVCRQCSKTYHPHVPPRWECVTCNFQNQKDGKPKDSKSERVKVWQQRDDPEGRRCAVCHNGIDKLRPTFFGHRVKALTGNPAHVCKRCGRFVCDACYDPNAILLPEYGYGLDLLVRVCTQCKTDIAKCKVTPPRKVEEAKSHPELLASHHDADDVVKILRTTTALGTTTRALAVQPGAGGSSRVAKPEDGDDEADAFVAEFVHNDALYDVLLAEEDDIAQEQQAVADRASGAQTSGRSLVTTLDERSAARPFWPPVCPFCRVHHGSPPKQWCCRSCGQPVWQPEVAPESAVCASCPPNQKQPKAPSIHCHRCGRLVCDTCGSYGQKLPEVGFLDGIMRPVCRGCYSGISTAENVLASEDLAQLRKEREECVFPAKCPTCNQRMGGVPPQWASKCHQRHCGQPLPTASGEQATCSLCNAAINGSTKVNCAYCGWLVCPSCSQYREPLPQRGFAPGVAQRICARCFHPRRPLLPDPTVDKDHWPAHCYTCGLALDDIPPRWRCPKGCGNVWQPLAHVRSQACACCGNATEPSTAGNCRVCGRIVCGVTSGKCGEGRAELLSLGFTRGMYVPVCRGCMSGIPASQRQEVSSSPRRPAAASPPRTQSPAPQRGGTSPPRNTSPMRGRGGRGGRGR